MMRGYLGDIEKISSSNNLSTMSNQSREEPEVIEENHQAECGCIFWSRVIILFHIIAHCTCMVVLVVYGQYDLFSSNYFYFIFSMILAFIGVWKDIDHLLMPYIFTVVCDTIYACMRILLLTSFYANNQTFFLNIFLYEYWPEKAQQLENLENDNKHDKYWISSILALFVGTITFSCMVSMVIFAFNHKQNHNNNQIISYRNTIHEQRQQLERESMLSHIPPPPSYQDFEDSVIVISPPQNGIPPPDYSIIEEHQIEPPAFSSLNESEILQENFSATITSDGPARSSSSIF